EEVEAVLGAREPDALDDPREAWQRLQALHRVRLEATEDFERLAVAFKRAKNIIGEATNTNVDPTLFEMDAERILAQEVRDAGFSVGRQRVAADTSADVVATM